MVDREVVANVALLSIKPRFASAILDGTKQVEFRKRPFRASVSWVVMYATSPVAAVVGLFEVKNVVVASPEHLWNEFGAISGLEAEKFAAYYEGKTQGVALVIGHVQKLASKLPLASINNGARPPQDYCYLPDQSLALIRSKSRENRLVLCQKNAQRSVDGERTGSHPWFADHDPRIAPTCLATF